MMLIQRPESGTKKTLLRPGFPDRTDGFWGQRGPKNVPPCQKPQKYSGPMRNPERSWSVLSTDHKPSGMRSSVDNTFRESRWVDNAFSVGSCGRRMGAGMREFSCRPLCTGFCFVADDGNVDAAPDAIFVRVPFPTHAFSAFNSPPRVIFVRVPGHNLSTDRDSLREYHVPEDPKTTHNYDYTLHNK